MIQCVAYVSGMCGTSLVLVLLCRTNIGVVDTTKELIIVLLEVCMCMWYKDACSVDKNT